MFDEVTLSIRCNNDKIESLGMTVSIEIGLPTEKSKVHQFQICCARTKYQSEIHRGRTIIVCAAKLFFANSPRLERVKCQNLGEFGSSDF